MLTDGFALIHIERIKAPARSEVNRAEGMNAPQQLAASLQAFPGGG